MSRTRVADTFQGKLHSVEDYKDLFSSIEEICANRDIDSELGEELKECVAEFLQHNDLSHFDNYSDKAYSRTYLGRSDMGWEAIVMGWKRGNRTSVHSHPQFAAYNFADGEFEVEIFEPIGDFKARLVERLRVTAPQSFYAIGKAGCYDNHIHRITCLSDRGHSLHIYSDDALQGHTYQVEE